MADSEDAWIEMQKDIGGAFVWLAREFGGVSPQSQIDFKSAIVSALKRGTNKIIIRGDCGFVSPEVEGESHARFVAKYFMPMDTRHFPDGYLRREKHPWKRELRQYRFLEGVPGVPKARAIKEILKRHNGFVSEGELRGKVRSLPYLSRAVILDFLDGDLLEKSLQEFEGEDKEKRAGRAELVLKQIRPIVSFGHQATANYFKQSAKGVGDLFDVRDPNIRFRDYARAINEFDNVEDMPIGLVEKVNSMNVPLVCAAVKRRASDDPLSLRVIQSDYTPANIVGNCVIDPKLQIDHGIMPIASLTASPGINLGVDEWREMCKQYLIAEAEPVGLPEGYKIPFLLRPVLGGSNDGRISPEIVNRCFGYFLTGVMDRSVRTVAKLADNWRFFPEEYRRMIRDRPVMAKALGEMRRNIDAASSEILANSKDYGMAGSEENIREYRDFYLPAIERLEKTSPIAITQIDCEKESGELAKTGS